MDNPCKYCNKRIRSVCDGFIYDCHDHCERYGTWKNERSEILERIHMEKDAYTNHDVQPYWKKHRKDSRRGQG